jgi:uncharacterized caspase-like protein
MAILARFLFSFAFAFLLVSPAVAEKRVALIVGNSAYKNVPILPNPVNDATAVAEFFKAARFDDVQLLLDANVAEMRHALGTFTDQSADADIAVVYFAGHGMEVDGVNYLIPTDAKLARDFDVEDEALSLDRVLKSVEAARRLRLVILDACRDNPFARTIKRSVASRSIGRGLGKVDPSVPNTLIAYSAKAGSVALDGDAKNSPFTSSVLQELAIPNLDLRLAFGRVRDDVLKLTEQRQEPFVYGSLGGETVSVLEDRTGYSDDDSGKQARNEAAQAWAATKDTKSVDVLTAFIKAYSSTFYAELARARLKDLQASLTPTERVTRPAAIEESNKRPSENKRRDAETAAKKPKRQMSVAACHARWDQSHFAYCKPNCPPNLVHLYLRNWLDCNKHG